MYEYKVIKLRVKECEDTFNNMAREGWRVISVIHNRAAGYGVVITLERKAGL